MHPDEIKQQAEAEHDYTCDHGADCMSRQDHVQRAYIPRITREKLDETQERNRELEGLNERLSKQLVGYSNRVNEAMRPALAKAWDQGHRSGASRAMRRMSDEPNVPDAVNPYREPVTEDN